MKNKNLIQNLSMFMILHGGVWGMYVDKEKRYTFLECTPSRDDKSHLYTVVYDEEKIVGLVKGKIIISDMEYRRFSDGGGLVELTMELDKICPTYRIVVHGESGWSLMYRGIEFHRNNFTDSHIVRSIRRHYRKKGFYTSNVIEYDPVFEKDFEWEDLS